MTTCKFRRYLITFRIAFREGFTTFEIARFINGARYKRNAVMVITQTLCSLSECWIHIKDLERDGIVQLYKVGKRRIWKWV
jgi:hypothetical protein